MRDLKFRAFEKNSGFMRTMDNPTYSVIGAPFKTPIFGDLQWFFGEFTGDYIIQQFIGIKDQNGVDIYEGDILKVTDEWKDTKVVQVRWEGEHDYPAFDLIPEIDEEMNSIAAMVCGDYQYEVIGNIYENGELLNA